MVLSTGRLLDHADTWSGTRARGKAQLGGCAREEVEGAIWQGADMHARARGQQQVVHLVRAVRIFGSAGEQ
jgi:hypothetical protein